MRKRRYHVILMTFCMLGAITFGGCGKAEKPQQESLNTDSGVLQEQEAQKQTETVEMEGNKVKKEMTTADFEAMFQGVKNIIPDKGINDTNPIMTQKYGADPYAMVYGDTV